MLNHFLLSGNLYERYFQNVLFSETFYYQMSHRAVHVLGLYWLLRTKCQPIFMKYMISHYILIFFSIVLPVKCLAKGEGVIEDFWRITTFYNLDFIMFYLNRSGSLVTGFFQYVNEEFSLLFQLMETAL